MKVAGWNPYLLALCLNAVIDLGHKITVQNVLFKLYDGAYQVALTALLNALILLPFILCCGLAGRASDRYPKFQVMRVSALFGLLGAVAVTLCYWQGWFWGAYLLTLLLGVQSAFYSPAKYGYIRELVGDTRVLRANGAVQGLTIVSILVATLLFSIGFEARYLEVDSPAEVIRRMVPLGGALIACALLELWMVSRLKAGQHHRQSIQLESSLPAGFGAIAAPTFRYAAVGLATFWSVSQGVLAIFPAYAKAHLGVSSTAIVQGVLACSGLGILIGALSAAKLSASVSSMRLVKVGALGLTAGVAVMTLLPSWPWLAANFLLVGVMGGLFVVPLASHLQLRAGEGELGRVLAASNKLENSAMLALLVATSLVATGGVESTALLWVLALLMPLGAGYVAVRRQL